jgi:hypothetical protein
MTAHSTHAAHPRHTQRGCQTGSAPRVGPRLLYPHTEPSRPARQGAVAAYTAAAELAPDVAAHPANVAAAALMQARARGPVGLGGCEAVAACPAACTRTAAQSRLALARAARGP